MHAVPYKSCRHYTAPTVFSYRASLQHFSLAKLQCCSLISRPERRGVISRGSVAQAVYKDEVNDEAVMLSSHIYFGTSTHICCPSIWL